MVFFRKIENIKKVIFLFKKCMYWIYLDFINYRDTLSAHTQAIVTFALCGFANLSSIAILLGGLGGMAPSRRKDIARLGLRAVLAGSMANLMSAAIAGFFLSLA